MGRPTTDEAGKRAALTRGQMASALRIAAGDGEPQVSGAESRNGGRVARGGSTVTLAMVLTGTLVAARLSGNQADFERSVPSVDGPAGSIPRNAAPARVGGGVAESRQEQAPMLKALTGMAAAMIGTSAGAQAVQWRVEDGGNGHWYQAFAHPERLSWTTSDQLAVAMGGHLVTITSASESAFLKQAFCGLQNLNIPDYRGPWIGLRYSAGAWTWVTGEPLQYTAWAPGQPDSIGYQNCVGWGPCEQMWGNEYGDDSFNPVWLLTEWDADCNHDGIVDYGQIRAGQLADANGNNIPDCCESSTPCTSTLHVPAEYPTIQAAIDAAAPGSRVLVSSGIYFERIDLQGKGIELVGVEGASRTIVDGQQGGTVITGANEPSTCVIDGFQIRNGSVAGIWSTAGGLSLTNSSATVRNCLFVGNRSMGWWGGGAVCTSGGSTTIENCMFDSNVNGDEPGGSAWHHLGGGSFVVRRCVFHDNTSNGLGLGGFTGGFVMKVNPEGAMCDGAITDCTFYRDHTGASRTSYWGVISLHRASRAIRIERCAFIADHGSQPMAVFSGMDSQASLVDCSGCGFAATLVGAGTVTNASATSNCNDCDSNGIPDLEEIASGIASDTNNDQIPDRCQCAADLNRDGRVDGADLAAILSFWGPSGTVLPAADLNHDGVVDGFDLSLVLSAWGPCGQ